MISEDMKKVLELFKQGRRFYKLQQFSEAKAQFAKALKIRPDDGPSKVYYARCKHYIESPPPEDWDGVFIMKTK